jgi:phage-related protein
VAGENVVSWVAVADFQRVQRESRQTAKDIRDLKKAQDEQNTAAALGAKQDKEHVTQHEVDRKKTNASEMTFQKALAGTATKYKEIQKLQADGVRSSQAEQKETNALAQAFGRVQSAVDNHAKAAIRLESAQTKLETRQARVTTATRAAEAATAQHAKTLEKFGAESEQVAKSLDRKETATRRAAMADQAARMAAVDVAAAHRDVSTAIERTSSFTAMHASQLEKQTAASERATAALGRHSEALAKNRESTTGRHSAAGGGGGDDGGFFKKIGQAASDAADGTDKMGASLGLLKFPAIIAGAAQLLPVIVSLAAGLFALGAAIAPAAGALATLPVFAGAAAQGLGTLLLAFSGVTAALKLQGGIQKAQESQALTSGQTQIANAQAVAAAQHGVGEAYYNQAQQAYNAANQIASAQHGLNNSLFSATQAQYALNQARIAAVRNVQDLRTAVLDAALAEESATLGLTASRAELVKVMNDPGSTLLARQQAQLAVQEAEAQLAKSKVTQQRAQVDSARADKAGVEGAMSVVDARHNVAEQTYAIGQAQANLAHLYVTSAHDQVAAQYAVLQAIQALGNAQRQASGMYSASAMAVAAYNQALAKLSPQGRMFVTTLAGMKGELKSLSKEAQAATLPGFTDAVSRLPALFPILSRAIRGTGAEFSMFASNMGKQLTTGQGLKDIGTLVDTNTRLVHNGLGAFQAMADVIRRVAVAAAPLAEWMSKLVLGWANHADKVVNTRKGYQGLVDFFNGPVKHALTEIGHIIQNIGSVFFSLGKDAYSSGKSMLDSIDRVTKKWADYQKTTSGKNTMRTYFEEARKVFAEVVHVLGDVFKWLGELSKNDKTKKFFQDLVNAFTPLVVAIGSLLTGSTAKQLGDILTQLAKGLGDISGNGQGLQSFVDVLSGLVSALDWFVKFPGVAQAIGAIALAFGAMKAIKLVDSVAHISQMTAAVGGVVADARGTGGGPGGVAGVVGGLGVSRKTRKADATARAAAIKEGKPVPAASQNFVGRYMSNRATKSASSSGGGAHAAPTRGAKIRSGMSTGLGKGAMGAGAIAGVAGLASQIPAFSKFAGVLQAVSLAMGIAAAAQEALNLAMDSNPVGLIILGIAALVAGFIYAYTHFKAVREAVKAVGDAFVWFYHNGIMPVVDFIRDHWSSIADMLVGPLKVGWALIKIAWTVIKDLFILYVDAIILYFKIWWWAISNILIKPIKIFWDWLKVAFGFISKVVSDAIGWIIGIVRRDWNAISNFLSGPIQAGHDLISGILDKVKGVFSDMWTFIKSGFSTFVDGLGKVWDGIKKIFESPVEFVVNTVLNGWVIGNLNKVLGGLGLSKIDPLPPVKFARGGDVKGYAAGGGVPGHGNTDTVPAMLTPGEFVLRKDVVQSVGLENLRRLNDSAGMHSGTGMGGMANHGFGDIVKSALGAGKSAWNATGGKVVTAAEGAAAWATKIAREGAGAVLSGLFSPVRALINASPKLGGGEVNKIMKGYPLSMMDAMVNFVKGAGSAGAGTVNNTVGGPQNNIGLDAGQMSNARAISAEGMHRGATPRDIQIAYMTGMVESSIRNLANPSVPESMVLPHQGIGSDHDSVGIYQQRNSWGSAADRLNPTKTTDLFLDRLLGLGNARNSMPMGVAAQTVQVSAFPDRYASFQDAAQKLYTAVNPSNPVITHPKNGGRQALNRGGLVQHFNAGGVVNGVGPGAHSMPAVEALRWLKGDSQALAYGGDWNAALVKEIGNSPATFPHALGPLPTNVPQGIAAWIGAHKPRSYDAAAKAMRLPYSWPLRAFQQNPGIFRKLLPAAQMSIMNSAEAINVRDIKDLQKREGVQQSGKFGADMNAPTDHMMYHALGLAHAADMPHPWSGPLTLADQAIADSDRANSLNQEWFTDLTTIASWGYKYLLDYLQEKGTADGLQLARGLIKDPAQAKALNDSLMKGKQGILGVNQTDQTNILQSIAYLGSGPGSIPNWPKGPIGIRALAHGLQVPDYAIVNYYDKIMAQGQLAPEKTAALTADVTNFRSGLFYAASGGRVPGQGNGDTVPAMLTPGEFVIRKDVVDSVGVDFMHAMNTQKFAIGGMVAGINGSAVPNVRTMSGTSGMAASMRGKSAGHGGGDVYITTEINNPTGENSVYSMTKMLDIKASTGVFDRSPKVSP